MANEALATTCAAIKFLLQSDIHEDKELSHDASQKSTKESLYHRFFRYLNGVSEQAGLDFWRKELEDAYATNFPEVPASAYQLCRNEPVYHRIEGIDWNDSSFTAETMIRAAWAILIARNTNSVEVLYGVVTKNQMSRLERQIMPLRLRILKSLPLGKFLEMVQHHAQLNSRFGMISLRHIARLSSKIERATRFRSILLIRQNRFESSMRDAAESESNIPFVSNDCGIILDCQVEVGGLRLSIHFDYNAVDKREVDRIVYQFEHVLRQISPMNACALLVGGISIIGSRETEEIWARNAILPKSADICVHDIFEKIAQRQPDAAAVCAWDGNLTYEELDQMSSRLARRILKRGLPQNLIVPICFEKSVWTSVAMIGVMKAGCAAVTLDTTLPKERLHDIIKQVKPACIISSVKNSPLARCLSQTSEIISVGGGEPPSEKKSHDKNLPSVSPDSTLYIIFTSGMTGTPKGMLILYCNFYSTISHQQCALGFSINS